jgi:hypothetical protein
MKLIEIINRLALRLGWENKEEKMQTPEALRKIIQSIEKTQEVELSCDDVYHLLDQYTELAVQDGNTEQLMPLVEHHIDICPDCREEFEALLRVLKATPV